MYVEDLNCTRI